MSTPRVVKIDPIPKFDADVPMSIEVPEGSTPESEFSRRRTALSGHRTGLSEERTSLSTLRSHLSNERTHLSYLRTSIALVGFGITLNRFAIYLIQNDRSLRAAEDATLEGTRSVGSGMVVLGFLVLAWAIFRFHRTSRDIERRRYHTDWRAVLTVSVLFLIIGVVATAWLFLG